MSTAEKIASGVFDKRWRLLGPFDLAESDERDQFVGAQAACPIGTVENAADEFPLVFMKSEYLLFDGIPSYQTVNRNGA